NDFGNFEDMSISGYKWLDANGNSIWDLSEDAEPGEWTIILDNDDNPDNGFIASATTDPVTGYYEFTGIGPDEFGDDPDGILHVYEVTQPEATQTYGNFSFDIESGLVISGDMFETEEGNFGNEIMMETANRTPGFWQSKLGFSLYNGVVGDEGDANGDGVPEGNKDFEKEGWSAFDLLDAYGTDVLGAGEKTGDGTGGGSDGVKDFLLWDSSWSSGDGTRDVGEDIYISLDELYGWVSGRDRATFGDTLERDVAAALLNTLNNFGLGDDGTGTPTAPESSIIDAYEDAIYFIFYGPGGTKKDQKSAWNEYGSDAHGVLSDFNERDEDGGTLTFAKTTMESESFMSTLIQTFGGSGDDLLGG
ncbi:hypothetical protein H0I76_19150, partial [Limibaculum sp. M0105]